MNKTTQLILGVVLLLAVAAGSFYGGMVYGKGQASTTASAGGFTANFGQNADGSTTRPNGFRPDTQGQAGGFGAQAGMLFGEIQAIEGNIITVLNRDGAEQQVQVTDTTLIEKNASVTVSDLTVGDTVIVSGSDNDDGSVTARSVQVSPAGRMFGGPPPTDQ